MISTEVTSQGIFRWTLLVTMLTEEHKRSPMLSIPVPPDVVQVGARKPAIQTAEQALAIRPDTAVILGNKDILLIQLSPPLKLSLSHSQQSWPKGRSKK